MGFINVSTHGSLAGADILHVNVISSLKMFQLTAPLREPTEDDYPDEEYGIVSTHGSLAGADF